MPTIQIQLITIDIKKIYLMEVIKVIYTYRHNIFFLNERFLNFRNTQVFNRKWAHGRRFY
jgi:hypothetical protein